jgi:hypothetical protein
MFAHLSRRETHPRTAARQAAARPRPRRLAAVLAAVTCGLLASAAIVPAAFATIIPVPGGAYGGNPAGPAPAPALVTGGGMAGWQITLIALGAALVAAAVAVLLDRALAARGPPSHPSHDAHASPARNTSRARIPPKGPARDPAGQDGATQETPPSAVQCHQDGTAK